MSRNSENYYRNNIRGGSRYGYCMEQLEKNIRELNNDESKKATPELIKDAITVTKVEDKYTDHPKGEICDPEVYTNYSNEIKKVYGISVGGNNRYNGGYDRYDDRHNGGYDVRGGSRYGVCMDMLHKEIDTINPSSTTVSKGVIMDAIDNLAIQDKFHPHHGEQCNPSKYPEYRNAITKEFSQFGVNLGGYNRYTRGGYDRYTRGGYDRDYYPNSMHGGALGILRDELGIKIMNNLRDEILQIEL
jgi:hypothetical protein